MQVLCERSNTGNDVRCNVCGQGFLVYWERSSRAEREQARRDVIQALADHHEDLTTGHPGGGGAPPPPPPPRYSGAALLGGAPAYAL
jgi:hypothetical protein